MSTRASEVTGITDDTLASYGLPLKYIMPLFAAAWNKADVHVAHNGNFDDQILNLAADALGSSKRFKCDYDTMKVATPLCKLPGPRGYKWPKLMELHQFLFNEEFDKAHSALADVMATARCYRELIKRKDSDGV
jgi:DNA polymerase III alpha subunit (gram-positive type)